MRFQDERTIMRYLLPAESLMWFGKPATGLIFRKSDFFLIPFSLAWGGFALFWEFMAYKSGAPIFFLLFGGVFVVVGLHMIFGRFFYDAVLRKNTIYAFTGERLLRLTGKTMTAWNVKDLPQASLRLLPDRSGTISFGGIMIPGFSRTTAARFAPPVLERIPAASDVFGLIQSAQSKLKGTADEGKTRTIHRGTFG